MCLLTWLSSRSICVSLNKQVLPWLPALLGRNPKDVHFVGYAFQLTTKIACCYHQIAIGRIVSLNVDSPSNFLMVNIIDKPGSDCKCSRGQPCYMQAQQRPTLLHEHSCSAGTIYCIIGLFVFKELTTSN